jgi:hypothetical protein
MFLFWCIFKWETFLKNIIHHNLKYTLNNPNMHAKTQLKVKDRKHTLNWYNKTKFIALYQIFLLM